MDLNKQFSKVNCISLNFFCFQTNPTEILEYSSDSEEDDGSENVLLIDSESSHKYHMDFGSDGRQVTERRKNLRVESTETILQTPKKQTKLPKTPESSAKRKKLLRLNTL